MPARNCGLCGETGELRDSHLIPKSIYKRLRKAIELDGAKNPNPVVVSEEVTVASSDQVTDYFLCNRCEQRFNTGGEKWVAENCWQADGSFPIREILQAVKPAHVQRDGLQFHEAAGIDGIDVAQIVYFAASVFWRAAAHQFGPILGTQPQQLVLGPYEDTLRAFLLGNGTLPKNVALIVTISSETDEGANELALFPFLRNKKSGATEYAFVIPGIGFQLFVGKTMDKQLSSMSMASAPHLVLLGSFEGFLRDMWKLISKSKKKRV